MTSELSVYQMKQWLEDRYCPTVLVQCTDDVEQICLKNALRFVDLLRPFESVYKESLFFENFSFFEPVLIFSKSSLYKNSQRV